MSHDDYSVFKAVVFSVVALLLIATMLGSIGPMRYRTWFHSRKKVIRLIILAIGIVVVIVSISRVLVPRS